MMTSSLGVRDSRVAFAVASALSILLRLREFRLLILSAMRLRRMALWSETGRFFFLVLTGGPAVFARRSGIVRRVSNSTVVPMSASVPSDLREVRETAPAE